MRSFFLNRNYPARTIRKVSTIDRVTPLAPNTRISNNRIPFTLTYHPLNNHIKPIINRNFSLLVSDSNTSNIFNDRPLFSFKRDRNLRSFLVKRVIRSVKSPALFVILVLFVLPVPTLFLTLTLLVPNHLLK